MKKAFLFLMFMFVIIVPIMAITTVFEEDTSIASAALNKTIKVYGPKDLYSVVIKFTNPLGVTLETSIMVLYPNGSTRELNSTNWSAAEQEMIFIPPEFPYPLARHNAQDNGVDSLLITTDKADAGNGVSIEVKCK